MYFKNSLSYVSATLNAPQPYFLGQSYLSYATSSFTPLIHAIIGFVCAYRCYQSFNNLFNNCEVDSNEPNGAYTDMIYNDRSENQQKGTDLLAGAVCALAAVMAFNYSFVPIRSTPQWYPLLGFLLAECAYANSHFYLATNELYHKSDDQNESGFAHHLSSTPTVKMMLNIPPYVVAGFSKD